MVHHLALRRFLGPQPDSAACLRFFAANAGAFQTAAAAKIAEQGLRTQISLHLTSRDLARQLTRGA